MAIYLAKAGQELLPAWAAAPEIRLRFFPALAGSLGAGLLYWMLRRSFKTSPAAAIAGAGLLLFSTIRLKETEILSPHHLMLACTLMIVGLGYRWKDTRVRHAAVGLGAVLAFGALSMTYVVPAAVCWAGAVSIAGKGWINRAGGLRISRQVAIMFATCVLLVTVVWPPGVLRGVIPHDFAALAIYGHHPTLVGHRIFEATPRWAAGYWLARLDAPLLLCFGCIALVAVRNRVRERRVPSKHAYLAISSGFFLATALIAHMAGARNLLQLIGVMCVATGALFDEVLGSRPRLIRWAAAAVVAVAALNLVWLSRSSSYTPNLATDGYRAFVKEQGTRLQERSTAVVYGRPILAYYAEQLNAPVAWDVSEMPWTTRSDAALSPRVKYVLMPEFVYKYMPETQPMRRVVAEHWRVVWSFKGDHVWELRLYERPEEGTPRSGD
jgi:hypothetical protein